MKHYICTNRSKVKCDPSECASCGWEKTEAERRKAYVREHGLTLCEDGLRRLVMDQEPLQVADKNENFRVVEGKED